MPKLVFSLVVSCIVVAAVTLSARYVQSEFVDQQTPSYLTYKLGPDIVEGVNVTVVKPGDDAATDDASVLAASSFKSVLDRIQSVGELRVGYNPYVIPFSYENNDGELVGFDIAYVHRLAADLNVKLRLVPFEWQSMEQDLEDHRFDLAVSGIYVTDDRLEQLSVTDPYFQSEISLIVPAANVDAFLSRAAIEAQTELTVGVFDDPILRPLAARLFPQAEIVVLASYDDLPDHPEVDAAIWTLEQAKSWAEPRHDYTAVVPKDLSSPFLIAYMLPKDAVQFTQFLNYWMRLQSANGFNERMEHHWLDDKPELKQAPRWSIVKDVLGWESD